MSVCVCVCVYVSNCTLMYLARPSLRGSCPLDVGYSSLMDNNELALALRESHLEKIAMYLSRCGLQSNGELLEKGYPDIGWDPVEGERFLDFLRFCVWVNGETLALFCSQYQLSSFFHRGNYLLVHIKVDYFYYSKQ